MTTLSKEGKFCLDLYYDIWKFEQKQKKDKKLSNK